MELMLHKGVGQIEFGMSPAQIKAIMGDDLSIAEDWMDGNLTDALLYPRMVLLFDEEHESYPTEDSQLVAIWIYLKEDITFQGQSLFNWYKHEFQNYLQSNNIFYEEVFEADADFLIIAEYNLEVRFDKDHKIDYVGMFAPHW